MVPQLYSVFDWFTRITKAFLSRCFLYSAFWIVGNKFNSQNTVRLNLKCYTTCVTTVNTIFTTIARAPFFSQPCFLSLRIATTPTAIPLLQFCSSTVLIVWFYKNISHCLRIRAAVTPPLLPTHYCPPPPTTANTTTNSNATIATDYTIPQNKKGLHR